MEITQHPLHRLFYPKSIAMVGASPKVGRGFGGNSPILGAIRQNFQGQIYPIHPQAESILGFKAYPSVRDIPGDVDLAIFSVPLSAVEKVMLDCAIKKVKFVHLYTSGFSETGQQETTEIENRIVQIAKEAGIRIVGPNCMGVYCPDGGLAWGEMFQTRQGPIGLFSQSGQLANLFIVNGESHRLAFSKVISFGNACDLAATDFLSYLAEDPNTEIIGAYLEGLKDGRTFLEMAKTYSRRKPMVIFKGGVTTGGARASQSHTAALAGSPAIWKGLCRQAGVIPATSKEELITTISALHRLPLPRGNRAALFGGAGGGSVTMTDVIENHGLQVPQLSDRSIADLEGSMPLEGHSVKNPIDMVPALFNREMFMQIMRLLDQEDHIDAIIFYVFTPGPVTGRLMSSRRHGVEGFASQIIEGVEAISKPFYFVLERDDDMTRDAFLNDLRDRMHEANIPTFQSLDLAAKAVYNMFQYHQFLSAGD